MERDNTTEASTIPDVALVPAASIGFLLYPSVVRLILANPPGNDTGNRAPKP